MTPEDHELLKRAVVLSEENNDMLRSIRRGMRWARFMTVVYWLIIIGISVGAYYYALPYIDKAVKTYNGATSDIDAVSKLFDSVKKTGQ